MAKVAKLPRDCAEWLVNPKGVELTEGQTGVLHGFFRGETAQVTAKRMGLTVRTVKYHRSQLLEALGVERMDELVARIVARR